MVEVFFIDRINYCDNNYGMAFHTASTVAETSASATEIGSDERLGFENQARGGGVSTVLPCGQRSLFEDAAIRLVNDAEGGIVYRPAWLPAIDAQRGFEALRDEIHWKAERRMMYEREVDVPRLTARFEIADFNLHPLLKHASQRIGEAIGIRFTSVGLNYYRDGRDSVAPHHDRLEDLVAGYPIALLSLGGTRLMHLSTQTLPRRRHLIDLEGGSLLTMSYTSQMVWLHAIPKRPEVQRPRIGIAFRVRPLM